MTREGLERRVALVRQELEEAANGRYPVPKLIAVTKTHSAEEILPLAEMGITEIGENRVQELLTKLPDLRDSFRSSVASAADTDHCDRCFDLQGLLDSSAVDRAGDLQLAALFLQGDGVIDGCSAESRGDAGGDQLSDRCGSQQHQSVSALSGFLCHGIRDSVLQKAALFCFDTDSIGFRADGCSCREELQTCADRRAFLHFNEN